MENTIKNKFSQGLNKIILEKLKKGIVIDGDVITKSRSLKTKLTVKSIGNRAYIVDKIVNELKDYLPIVVKNEEFLEVIRTKDAETLDTILSFRIRIKE